MLIHDPIIERMQVLIDQWDASSDPKAVFLRCYQMMTSNMLEAIERQEFEDSQWVDRLLHRFAEYYFIALEEFEQDSAIAPQVWQLAHDASQDGSVSTIQKLILGVNAHINYDLVLTLWDLLEPEWRTLPESLRQARHSDHHHVNDIIAQTIDAVQDQVIEPDMPLMDWIDRLLGPVDEYLVSRLITEWRENVWDHALELLRADDPDEQTRLVAAIEEQALRTGRFILLGQ